MNRTAPSRRLVLASALSALALGLSACQQAPAPPDWVSSDFERCLRQARELHFLGVDGDEDAAAQAFQLFEELRQRDPESARVVAYLGSAWLLRARDAWAPWEKGEYGKAGLALLDRAVARAPGDVEIRFVRGISTIGLPEGFGRGDLAREDLELAAARADDAWRAGTIDDRIHRAALNGAKRFDQRTAGGP